MEDSSFFFTQDIKLGSLQPPIHFFSVVAAQILLEFSPRIFGEDDPIWRAYFSNGLVQPPTSSRMKRNVLNQSGRWLFNWRYLWLKVLKFHWKFWLTCISSAVTEYITLDFFGTTPTKTGFGQRILQLEGFLFGDVQVFYPLVFSRKVPILTSSQY